jgi:hypothetical protein
MRPDVEEPVWRAFMGTLADSYREIELPRMEEVLIELSQDLKLSTQDLKRRIQDPGEISVEPTRSQLIGLGVENDPRRLEHYLKKVKLLQTLVKLSETVDSQKYLELLIDLFDPGCELKQLDPKAPYIIVGLDLESHFLVKLLHPEI